MYTKKFEIECWDYPCGYLLRCLVEFASFICVCIIVGLSRKDPFEKHIIGNLTNYFNDISIINTSTSISNMSMYNNSILINDKKIKINLMKVVMIIQMMMILKILKK